MLAAIHVLRRDVIDEYMAAAAALNKAYLVPIRCLDLPQSIRTRHTTNP